MNELPPPGSTLRQVLPGTPEDLDELAALLECYVDGAAAAARGLRSMDSGAWIGEAADAFWSSVGDVLKKLDEAAAAFQEAVFALRTYTAVLREAQADVCRALGLIDRADTDSRLWAAKNADAIVQNVTASYTGVVAPVSPDDPGEALRHQAQTLISDAKDRVAAAARHAAERLDMAADYAPRKPGFLSRSWHVVSEVASGAAESVTEMATFTFKLSPAYAIVDPDGYVEHGVGLVKGLAYGATHPVDFAKAVLDWDTWAESPGRALGHLVPAIALAVATAGAGAAGKASSGVKAAEALAAGERAEGVAGRALQGLDEVAAGAARPLLSPAKQAAALQGTRVYPGIDAWENVTLKAGTKVFAGEPGVTGFATSAKGAAAAGNDAAVLNKGLQIAPHAGTFRPGLTEFRLTKDVEAARSIALANPQFGPGGIEQFYIPNFGEVTQPIVSTIMRNRAP